MTENDFARVLSAAYICRANDRHLALGATTIVSLHARDHSSQRVIEPGASSRTAVSAAQWENENENENRSCGVGLFETVSREPHRWKRCSSAETCIALRADSRRLRTHAWCAWHEREDLRLRSHD
jgi:hypothetical protein